MRLSGADAAVRAARAALGGELADGADEYWESVREQRLAFFAAVRELWRVSLPAHSPVLPVAGPTLIEWGGSLRWLPGPQDGGALRALAARLGGHATLYRAPVKPPEGPFQPLSPAMLSIHKRLKAAFDPRWHLQSRPAVPWLLAMQTRFSAAFLETPAGQEADAILRKCVHCGFCTATCPTYQLLGDELDGPRGRIYLIKEMLEGAAALPCHATAPRSLSDLPRLRDDVPIGRRLRPPAGYRPASYRAGGAPGTVASGYSGVRC